MKCQRCGAKTDGNFCAVCGTPLQTDATGDPGKQEQGQQSVQDQKTLRKKKPVYKRAWFWILVVLAAILVLGIGCGMCAGPVFMKTSELDPPASTDAGIPAPIAEPQKSDNDISIEEQADDAAREISLSEQTVYDAAGIRVTILSLDMKGSFFGPEIKLLVENASDKEITVQARALSINGLMADCVFSCSVAAGKKANDEITLMASELEHAGINVLQTIEFRLHIFETSTLETIADSDMITLKTSADAGYVQHFDDSGTVAVERDGIRIVMKRLDSADSFWGMDIYLYIENNTDRNVTIQTRSVSINGFMVNPIFSCDIVSGKKAFDTITFFESDLTDNGITEITDLELVFHVFDTDSWDTIFDTETISVRFD